MRTLSRTLLVTLMIAVTGFALVTSTATSQGDQPLEGVSIEQANASWLSAAPVTQVHRALLEQLGAEVQVQQFSSNGLAYQALELGDLDFWANGWFPLHNPQLPGGREEFVKSATIFEPHCANCGLQGYLIDIPSINEFEISSLLDFKGNAELQEAFDEDGDGKADLFGCPPGWGCNGVIEAHLDLYDLRDAINHVNASYPANFSAAKARIDNGQPTLWYTWTPNFTTLQLVPGEDVQWINLVDNVEDVKKAPTQEELPVDAVVVEGLGDKAVSDPLIAGHVVADIRTVANNDFLSNHPAANALFKQVSLPLNWLNEATTAVQQEDADPAELAEQWIADNAEKTDEWLQAAREAAAE